MPFGAYKIGRIASDEETWFITNDVMHDPRVHDHEWAASLGLVSFAGFRLVSAERKPIGVLAFFSRQLISPEIAGFLQDLATTASQVVRTGMVELALQASEGKFRSLAESSPDHIMRYDRECRHTFMNPAALRVSGLAEEQIIGKTHRESGFDESQSRFWEEKITQVFETGKPYHTQFAWESVDGRVVLDWMLTPEFSDDGTVRSVLGVSRDITQLKKAEEELLKKNEELNASYEQISATEEELRTNFDELTRRELALRKSEERYRSLFEGVPIGLYRTTPSGQILDINPALVRLLGYPDRESLLVVSVSDLYMDPGDRSQWLALVEREGIVRDFEVQFRKYDGTIIWVRDTGEAVRDDSNQVIYYNGNVEDITERKRTEKSLRESENLFRSVGDSLLDPVFILSSEGIVQFANRAAILFIGLPDTAIIRGQSLTTYLDGDSQNRAIADLHTIHELGGPHTAEYCVNPLKGEQRWVEACGVRIDYKESRATLVTLRDITERIRVEEQLRGSERRLADIISFLPDATFVIDKNGAVLAWNRAMVEMTGVPAEQMIGKANYEYALPFYHEQRPIMVDLILHDDPAVVAKYLNMKKEGSSLFSEIFIPHLNKGRGAHLWFTASPLYDAAGNLTGAIESIRDITERKHAEDALRESEERYHNVVEDAD